MNRAYEDFADRCFDQAKRWAKLAVDYRRLGWVRRAADADIEAADAEARGVRYLARALGIVGL